jgi:hypothetical protein
LRTHGIVIARGDAGTEIVPSSTRAVDDNGMIIEPTMDQPGDDIGSYTKLSEKKEKIIYIFKEEIAEEDIRSIVLSINKHYNLVIYADASFAVGTTMQSVSGYVIFLNGIPLLWGSLKQTIVVDSSCSAEYEYVAASVACKQTVHAENIVGFLGFPARSRTSCTLTPRLA